MSDFSVSLYSSLCLNIVFSIFSCSFSTFRVCFFNWCSISSNRLLLCFSSYNMMSLIIVQSSYGKVCLLPYTSPCARHAPHASDVTSVNGFQNDVAQSWLKIVPCPWNYLPELRATIPEPWAQWSPDYVVQRTPIVLNDHSDLWCQHDGHAIYSCHLRTFAQFARAFLFRFHWHHWRWDCKCPSLQCWLHLETDRATLTTYFEKNLTFAYFHAYPYYQYQHFPASCNRHRPCPDDGQTLASEISVLRS